MVRTAHIRNRIDEYLQGAVDSTARAQIDSHLSQCRGCRAALEDARNAIAMMSWLPHPEAAPLPGPEFYYRVRTSIEEAQASMWIPRLAFNLHPRLAITMLMMGMLLLAWMISLPRHGSAMNPDGWDEVEYPSADFARMTYSDDQDEARHDRMMDNLFGTADAP